MIRGFFYVWAVPNTIIGLVVGILTLLTRGSMQCKDGVLELSGGFTLWFLRTFRVKAMTLGHVVLGRDLACLNDNRSHEHAHVRQAEIFGPFFLPAYAAASAWALLRGKHYYKDNWFELDADRRCGEQGEMGGIP